MTERAPRKTQTGRVVSDRMDKTLVVAIERRTRHRLYHKSIRHVSKFMVHDEANEYRLGDLVRIVETRPLSRTKRWRVAELLSRADVPDVAAVIAADVPEPEIEPAEEEVAAVAVAEAEVAEEEAAAEEPVAEAEVAEEEAAAEEPVAEAEAAEEEAAAEEPVAEAEVAEEEAAAEEPEEAPKPAPRRRTRAAPKAEADAAASDDEQETKS